MKMFLLSAPFTLCTTFPLSPLVRPVEYLLLRSAQYRDITGLPEWKCEEACLVIAASKNKVRTVRRPPNRDVGLAVFVVISRDRPIAVLAERYRYKTRRIGASLHEPCAFRWPEDGKVRTAIAVEIAVHRQVTVDAELADAYATVAGVKREPRPLAWPEDGGIG